MNHGSVSFFIREILNTDSDFANVANEYIPTKISQFKTFVVVIYFSECIHDRKLSFSLKINFSFLNEMLNRKLSQSLYIYFFIMLCFLNPFSALLNHR